jgi:hypothetical protein
MSAATQNSPFKNKIGHGTQKEKDRTKAMMMLRTLDAREFNGTLQRMSDELPCRMYVEMNMGREEKSCPAGGVDLEAEFIKHWA